jgi:hypothetical protein
MIVLRLYGGLGNQLFQLGAAFLLAEKSNISRIVVDTSQIVNYSISHKFVLNELLDFELVWEKLGIGIEFESVAITRLRIPKLVRLNNKFNPFISDNNFIKAIAYDSHLKVYLLDGYFQECLSQEMFNRMTVLLARLIRSSVHNLGENKTDYDVVAHVRGTDFLSLNRNPLLNEDFYLTAVEALIRSNPLLRILVVTDDKKYASKIFTTKFNEVDFVIKAGDEIEDFMSIYKIPNRILAPSTFGLMASTLGDNSVGAKVFTWPYWYETLERVVLIPNEVPSTSSLNQ